MAAYSEVSAQMMRSASDSQGHEWPKRLHITDFDTDIEWFSHFPIASRDHHIMEFRFWQDSRDSTG
jgi:hypothetical protein